MPHFNFMSFVDPLSDEEIAAVSNYVLGRYGNPAAQVSANDVKVARAGGAKPLLAVIQPYILPAMLAGLLLLAVFVVRYPRRRATH
jgi:formaldehyde-activating enzyme involved in methanogenesis